jgi:hypothetical protein
MAVYQIHINEKMALGKSLVTLLQSVPHVVTFEPPKKKEAKKSWLYYELEEAFNDVRLMREGKIKEKTAQEFLEEIRNSK